MIRQEIFPTETLHNSLAPDVRHVFIDHQQLEGMTLGRGLPQ